MIGYVNKKRKLKLSKHEKLFCLTNKQENPFLKYLVISMGVLICYISNLGLCTLLRPLRSPPAQEVTTVMQNLRWTADQQSTLHPKLQGSYSPPGITGRCQREKEKSQSQKKYHRFPRVGVEGGMNTA